MEKRDIRERLQKAEEPSDSLDIAIADALAELEGGVAKRARNWSRDFNLAISHIESKGYDWIMGNVNGHFGGTPYGCVGVREDKASYSGTVLLSLWLSYFRLELGDERSADV
jgi:hypothetical protein